MATKRGRSLSSTDEPPTKRAQNSETTSHTGDHQLHLHSSATNEAPALTTAVHTVSIITESSRPIAIAPVEGQEDAQQEVETVGADVSTVLEEDENLLATVPPVGLMVVAPEFNVVYDSWEAFEKELKEYAKATYQLYVIRSTTSVKRRNFKIAESAARGDTTGSHAGVLGKALELGGADVNVEQAAERTLIPERFLWYSKSMKCTHGWKDRHRGTGKRGSGVVRSTSCPAKMCVTLQHRGAGTDGWKVVVTKHVRTHNHQLSKELYLYYTENRRIYDPELLAVVGDGSAAATETLANAHLTSLIDQANQRAGLYRILTSSEDATAQSQQQASSMAFIASESSASSTSVSNGSTPDGRANNQLAALSEASRGNFIIRPRIRTGAPLAAMPPPGTMVLTPGTIPSKAMDGGGFCVPRVSVKVHPSWDAFHDYVAQYTFDTAQVFRTRSTVSVAARNTKILASVANKAGADGHDIASYASYAGTSPASRLIPEEYKWFSKLLICTYGWKRRTRIKCSRLAGENGEGGPCPAMLLARMERNVDGEWNVVINRQVQEHNHRLNGHVEETDGRSHEAIASTGDATRAFVTAPPFDSTPTQSCQSADTAVELECETIATEASDANTAALPPEHREIVVRVPKLQSVFNSWDDFHASLKAYSDSTYQLYRTRTTSSAKGRNKKIAQMKRGGDDENEGSISDLDTTLSGVNATRKIPDSWRWYSKTLTCTHGWKERNRGTGKRSAHGVRSTACPVKICATVQFLNPTSRLENDTESGESNSDASNNCWHVVVTKHIVDHNHNLSRELYQHYCENRRIYDPELLAIDASNEGAVVKRKVHQRPDHGTIAEDHSMQSVQPGGGQIASQPPMFSTQLEAGLTEVVNHVQLFGSLGNNHAVGIGGSGATTMHQPPAAMSATVGGTLHVVPSVVLLPYTTPSSYLPGQMQSPAQHQHQVQEEEEQRRYQQHDELVQGQATLAGNSAATQPKRGDAGNVSAATIATPANIVLINSAGIATSSSFHQSGSNVSCRVHGSSSGTIAADNDVAAKASAAQCTCFRIAGASNYVAIVPASEPLAHAETGFDGDDDTMLYAEDTEGVWQPSSNVEIEKVTTENGEMIWRVPRLVRRYPTWEAFHKYLDAYSAATFQLYRVRTTYSVKSRNTRLRQLAASRGLAVREGENGDPMETEQEGVHGLSRAHLVPEQYEWYSKTFLCTHGWKRRSRGSGQRVSHNVRATECPAKVCATLQRIDGATTWSVVVTKHLTEHNHEISEVIYQQYSEVRRVKDPEVLARAEQLWRGGATRRRVFEFLKERSPNRVILMKDVHNLVQRWQSQERRPRQEHQQDDGDDEQERPSENPPPVVSTTHGDESAPWL